MEMRVNLIEMVVFVKEKYLITENIMLIAQQSKQVIVTLMKYKTD